MLPDPSSLVSALRELQRRIRAAVVAGRGQELHAPHRDSSADTIYNLDLLIEPIVVEFCEAWGRSLPMVVVAEGIEPETGRAFPDGLAPDRAAVRVILDPVDGTRGLMFDKRPAWSLAGIAPNRGPGTRLADIEVAVMTELPTSKMGSADVLWAVKGQGAHAAREDLAGGPPRPLPLRPSRADTIAHGFAMVANFFPGTKVLTAELMERIVAALLPESDRHRGIVFDDQYISTGGQFYELAVGHDRFNADLRSLLFAAQGISNTLCCHPYDCCTALVAQEAGVILTDARGGPLDGPFDVTTGLAWAGFANARLRESIEPVMLEFLRSLPHRA